MQNENTPTEGQNSAKLDAESALRDAACSPSDFEKAAPHLLINVAGRGLVIADVLESRGTNLTRVRKREGVWVEVTSGNSVVSPQAQ
jgi:hypothetical protein